MKRSLFVLTFVISAVALAGCKNPASDVPAAQVSETATEQAPAEAAPTAEPTEGDDEAAAQSATLNPENTTLGFVGSKVTDSHDGGWEQFSGAITVPNGEVVGGSVELTIQMGTIFADADRLTNHLRSDDFFSAAQFPEASFRSTNIVAGEGENVYNVTGTLTIKGTSKDVTFPATIVVADGNVKADAEFAINRQLWGISYTGMPDDLIRDEVVIKFSIDAPLS